MKKVLSILMVLAMLCTTASVAVFAEAELGTYENPYQVQAGAMTPVAVTIPAEGDAYVAVDDANNSTLTIGHSTSADYTVYYCRMPIAPEADGTMVFTMVDGADYFNIVNPTAEAITVRIMLEAGSGAVAGGTIDNPEELVLAKDFFGNLGAMAEQDLAAGNQGYFYKLIAPADGVISVSIYAYDEEYNSIGWMYFVNNLTSYRYGDNHLSDEEEPVFYDTVKVAAGDELQIFTATYDPANKWANPAGMVGINVSFSAVGSWDCPEEITAGDHSASLEAGNFSGYNYKWTAPEEGVATITMNTADNWTYCVNGEMADGSYVYGDTHWSDDDPVVKSESINVQAGDILTVMVNTYDPAGMNPAGNIDWTLSFVAGETGDEGGDEGGGDIGGGDDIGGDEPLDVNWELSDLLLAVGTDSYAASNLYPYTVYAFEPSEEGKYTFSSTDSLIGLVSNNGMWITAGTSTEAISNGVVAENTFEWTCTSIGQSIWVAALPDTNVATITVDFEEVEIKEIPREYYENTVTPEAFVFEGNAESLLYVDTFDGKKDEAVLGEDGFYHLNSADGPILYANLDDVLMSLVQANGYGQLKQLIKENGEVVKIIDYTVAMLDYIACMDENTSLYPLTADLIEVFSKAGGSLGWYGEEGWIGGVDGDEWMFACYYLEGNTGAGTGTGDNTGAGDNAGADNNTNNGSPVTGDNAMVVAALAAVALLGMAAVVIVRKRRLSK